MSRRFAAILVACLGCSVSERSERPSGHVVAEVPRSCEGCGHGSAAEALAPSVQSTASAAGRAFGAPVDPTVVDVALASIIADPEGFQDRTIRTHGTVVRVCQRMGCWMEISDEGSPSIRVPMANHAFFLPRDVAGRSARIEARVRVAPLSAAMREHLAAEGAEAVTSTLSLEATGVVVD